MFSHHKTLILLALTGVVLLVVLGLAELLLRSMYGLGNPVLYRANPLYGYRPQPHQEVTRFSGARIQINNLGLRASRKWDSSRDGRVLFLGDSVTYGGSYIDNDELFSELAVQNLKGVESGNGGVNGWGVENVHGLLVRSEFLPARTYVTLFIPHDFYRGVTSQQAVPYWSRNPSSALEELLQWGFFKFGQRRYRNWASAAEPELMEKMAGISVGRLAEIDAFLRARGLNHVSYISPTIQQVLGVADRDPFISKQLAAHSLEPIYLIRRLQKLGLAESEVHALYKDNVHLTVEGHRTWASLIEPDLRALYEAGRTGISAATLQGR